MKLMIRFADQIVGVFIILALGILIFVIFMLGANQRWFSRDYEFRTYFSSASGLSQNMAVQHRGFTIGNIKSISLTDDDRVEVLFIIFDTYIDRVREGSMVEIVLSPIGGLGGNQFLFYPGLGEDLLGEGAVIPSANSSEGRRLISMGIAERPEQDDSITRILERTANLLDTFNTLFLDIHEALEGSSRTSLGRAVGDIELTVAGIRQTAQRLPEGFDGSIEKIMAQLEPALANIRILTERIADPDSSVMAILDSERDVYTSLVSSLDALSAIMQNLERTSAFLPEQLPQVAALLSDLYITLNTAQDVLVSLTNNPLLRRGVPQRIETGAGGTHARDVEF